VIVTRDMLHAGALPVGADLKVGPYEAALNAGPYEPAGRMRSRPTAGIASADWIPLG